MNAPRDPRVDLVLTQWGPRMLENGVPAGDYLELAGLLAHWEDWCPGWAARGAVHERLGHDALAAQAAFSAGEHFTRAALCYHFAKFLGGQDPAATRAAHRKAVECRARAVRYLVPRGERVEIPFERGTLAAILRKPEGVRQPPLVVMAMGLLSAKEEMDAYERTFLARGLATLAVDGPGQGEAEYDLALRADYEVPAGWMLDWAGRRADIDPARVGMWGVSLGGYFAARASAFHKRVKACVALSAPYDWAAGFDAADDLMREAFRVRSHSATMNEACAKAGAFTLGGVAANIACPILIVAGELDRITPPHDARRLAAEVAGPAELLIVPGGTHVANNRAYVYRPHTADWLARTLRA